MIRSGEEIIGAVIGPSKCGKTTLAEALTRKMRVVHGLRSIVYDPFKYKNTWGPWCWVTDDLDKFKHVVFSTKGCCVIWDESSDTLNPKKDRKFSTRIRHEHKASYMVAHDLMVMDPLMRSNIGEVYIFRQDPDRARDFARIFVDMDLMQLSELEHREFIVKRPFQKIVRMKPTVEELKCLR